MKLLNILKQKWLHLKYKLFPETFEVTPKGEGLANYCRKCLEPTFSDKDKNDWYEDAILNIQQQTNSSRTMAIIYLLSVLDEVKTKQKGNRDV